MDTSYLKILKTISKNYELQIHILSHFSKVGKNYKNLLIRNHSVTEAEIDKKLTMSGSKFYNSFANDPVDLCNKIIIGYKNHTVTITERDSSTTININYPRNKFKLGIGGEGIIHINKVSNIEKKMIEPKSREGYKINTLRRKHIPVWELNIILNKEKNNFYIKTIFPGRYAPPFPDKGAQTEIEHSVSNNFWDNHILLITE